jgi:polar amino acid transport system substrate-binding protein
MFNRWNYLFLSVALLIPNLALANSAAEGKLVIAFSQLAPWKSYENGQFKGAYAALGSEIAKRLNMTASFEHCSLKRCLSMMKVGYADIIIGIKDTPERQQYMHFLKTPYRGSNAKVFYLLKNSGYEIKTYEDLYNIPKIGEKMGGKYFPRFDKDNLLQKEPVNNNRQNFLKLERRRIDTFVIAEDQGEFLIHELGLRDKVKKAEYFYKDYSPRYLAVSKKSSHIDKLGEFERVMSQIKSSGALRKIMVNHFFLPYNIPTTQFQWE